MPGYALLLQLGGSLAAIAAVAGLVRWLGMGQAPRIADADAAMALSRDTVPDFRPATAHLSPDRAQALVVGVDGRHVVVRPHGARLVAALVD